MIGRARIATMFALAALLAAPALDAAPKVSVRGGALKVGGKNIRKSTPYRDGVGLPDGTVIAVRESGVEVDTLDGPVDTGLVVRVDPKTGRESLLLEGHDGDAAEERLLDLDTVIAHPDGKSVFIYARSAAPGLGAVWRMNADGTGARYLGPAGHEPAVVQKGPWKGHVVTTQRLMYVDGGAWWPVVILDPNSGQVAGICSKPPKDRQSVEAEMVPHVPVKMLKLNSGAKNFAKR